VSWHGAPLDSHAIKVPFQQGNFSYTVPVRENHHKIYISVSTEGPVCNMSIVATDKITEEIQLATTDAVPVEDNIVAFWKYYTLSVDGLEFGEFNIYDITFTLTSSSKLVMYYSKESVPSTFEYEAISTVQENQVELVLHQLSGSELSKGYLGVFAGTNSSAISAQYSVTGTVKLVETGENSEMTLGWVHILVAVIFTVIVVAITLFLLVRRHKKKTEAYSLVENQPSIQ